MAIREIDAIGDAIIATEKEIAGEAWGQEDSDVALDETGDRSLEDMGEGLEGQHEAEDDDELEGEEAEGEEESEVEGEADGGKGETEGGKKPVVAEEDGKTKAANLEQPEGRVPPGKYREIAERARAAETERDALKAQIEKAGGENKSLSDRLDLVMREIVSLKQAPRSEAKPAEPAKVATPPDIFEDPKGFVDHLTNGFQAQLDKRDAQIANHRVETSMTIAHAFHKDVFENAFAAINKLNPQNPEDRMTVQRIYSAPNPGEALVSWHKRNETFARVGDDPNAFEERIRNETRQSLIKDPEFRKQLLAELRGEAAQGDDGRPRTTIRLPRSLAAAPGSSLRAERDDPRASDDSDQAVADAAWR